jgi:hypothetical protein
MGDDMQEAGLADAAAAGEAEEAARTAEAEEALHRGGPGNLNSDSESDSEVLCTVPSPESGFRLPDCLTVALPDCYLRLPDCSRAVGPGRARGHESHNAAR